MDVSAEFLKPLAALGPFFFLLLFRPVELAAPARRENGRAHVGVNVTMGFLSLGFVAVVALVLTDPLLSLFPARSPFSIAALPFDALTRFVVGFAAIDFAQYCLHRAYHAVPWLWRLHRLHHADEFVTASTGFLHHPLESATSFVALLAFLVTFGVPVGSILVYNAVAAAHAIFVHGNVALPPRLDRWLSLVIFTPSGHRVHHSLDGRECNANFGQVFPYWDRLLRTLIAQPAKSGEKFEMGLPDQRLGPSPRILTMLASPID